MQFSKLQSQKQRYSQHPLQQKQEEIRLKNRRALKEQQAVIKRRMFVRIYQEEKRFNSDDNIDWDTLLNIKSLLSPQAILVIEKVYHNMVPVCSMDIIEQLKHNKMYERLFDIAKTLIQTDEVEQSPQINKNIQRALSRILWILAVLPEEMFQQSQQEGVEIPILSHERVFELFISCLEAKKPSNIIQTLFNIVSFFAEHSLFVEQFTKSEFAFAFLRADSFKEIELKKVCLTFQTIFNNLTEQSINRDQTRLMVDYLFAQDHQSCVDYLPIFTAYTGLIRKSSKCEWIFTDHYYDYVLEIMNYLVTNSGFDVKEQIDLRSRIFDVMEMLIEGIRLHQPEEQQVKFLENAFIKICKSVITTKNIEILGKEENLVMLGCLRNIVVNPISITILMNEPDILKDLFAHIQQQESFQHKRAALRVIEQIMTRAHYEDIEQFTEIVFETMSEQLVGQTDNEIILPILKSLMMVFKIEAFKMLEGGAKITKSNQEKNEHDSSVYSKDKIASKQEKVNMMSIDLKSLNYNGAAKVLGINKYWVRFERSEAYKMLDHLMENENQEIYTLVTQMQEQTFLY